MSPQLNSFFGVKSLIKAQDLITTLTQPVFFLKHTGLTRRVLNHWDKEDLLNRKRDNIEQWRKFDFVEYVWLRVALELRELGIPIPMLRALKINLFETISTQWMLDVLRLNEKAIEQISDDEERAALVGLLNSDHNDLPNKDIPILLLIITEVITSKQPFCILVFKDGSFIPWVETKYEEYAQEDLNRKAYETHFSVSISQIFKEFLGEDTFVPFLPRLNLLERNELRLLELISSGEYDSITIHFKNKKMKSLEMVKEQDVKRKVVDIISENLYQDIVIKSHKGMVTRIQNTVKLKLD